MQSLVSSLLRVEHDRFLAPNIRITANISTSRRAKTPILEKSASTSVCIQPTFRFTFPPFLNHICSHSLNNFNASWWNESQQQHLHAAKKHFSPCPGTCITHTTQVRPNYSLCNNYPRSWLHCSAHWLISSTSVATTLSAVPFCDKCKATMHQDEAGWSTRVQLFSFSRCVNLIFSICWGAPVKVGTIVDNRKGLSLLIY